MIRMALDSVNPKVTLEFDTPNRKVRIFHGDNAATIEARMQALGLGATLEHKNVAKYNRKEANYDKKTKEKH